jgi:phosphate/sulfate permease
MDKINEYSANETVPQEYYTCNAITETAYELIYPEKYNNLNDYLTIESQREIARPDLELVYIHFASMIASASWQLFATSFSLPVSGTHSIIGALVGGALASSAGHKAITWSKIGGIVLSWVTSPTLSCIAAYFIYRYIGSNIIQSNDPIQAARRSFPVFMGLCMFLNGYALVLIQLKPCQPTDLDLICNWPTQEFTASIGIGYSYRKYICSLIYAVPFGLLIWLLAKVFAMPLYEKKDQELLNMKEIPEKFSKTLSSERLLSDKDNNNAFSSNNMKLKPIQSLVKIEEEDDKEAENSLEDSESDPKVFSSETHGEPDARMKKDSLSKKDSVVSRTDSFRVNLLQKQLSEKRDSDAEKTAPNSPVKLGRFVVNSVDPNTPRKTRQPSYKAKSNFLHDLTVQTLRPAALKYHKSEPDMYSAFKTKN